MADAVRSVSKRPSKQRRSLFGWRWTGHAQTRKWCRDLVFFLGWERDGRRRSGVGSELPLPEFIAGPFKSGLFETKQNKSFSKRLCRHRFENAIVETVEIHLGDKKCI